MTANAHLLARTDSDVPDSTDIYGPGWHGPLPEPLRPGMSVKIGLKGEDRYEWPWATIRRVLNDKIWLQIERTVWPEEHGIQSGAEIEARSEHLHMVVEQDDKRVHAAVLQQWQVERLEQMLTSAAHFAERLDAVHEGIDRCALLGLSPTARQLECWAHALAALSEQITTATGMCDFTFRDLLKAIKPLQQTGGPE